MKLVQPPTQIAAYFGNRLPEAPDFRRTSHLLINHRYSHRKLCAAPQQPIVHTPPSTSMKTILPFALVTALTAFTAGSAAAADTRCYEMRIYYAAPGKLDALNSRFRDHTCKLFENHGMMNIGYWLPITNTENKLVYLLAYPSRDAREKSWKEFMRSEERRVGKECRSRWSP